MHDGALLPCHYRNYLKVLGGRTPCTVLNLAFLKCVYAALIPPA